MNLIFPFLIGLLALIQLSLLILIFKDISKSDFKSGIIENIIWSLIVFFVPLAGSMIYLILRKNRIRNKNRNGILQ